MATISLVTPVAGSSLRSWVRPVNDVEVVRVLDFAEATTANETALLQNDLIDIMTVDAGMFISKIQARIVAAASTASTTIQVGDADSATGWITSVTCDSAVNTCFAPNGSFIFTQSGTVPYAVTPVGGKLYTSAGVVKCKINSSAAPYDGKVELVITVKNIGLGATKF